MSIEKVNVPEGQSGVWRVERFEVERGNVLSILGYGARAPTPGVYTRLMRGNTVVMSDTQAEMRDHLEPVARADGHCLVNGLGLGMVVVAMASRANRVTVIEQSKDVINLVASHLPENVDVIHSCAFDYQPPKGLKYGAVWHDIWDNLCTDNLEEMGRLHRKYGRRSWWQGSWGFELLKVRRRQEKREEWQWRRWA